MSFDNNKFNNNTKMMAVDDELNASCRDRFSGIITSHGMKNIQNNDSDNSVVEADSLEPYESYTKVPERFHKKFQYIADFYQFLPISNHIKKRAEYLRLQRIRRRKLKKDDQKKNLLQSKTVGDQKFLSGDNISVSHNSVNVKGKDVFLPILKRENKNNSPVLPVNKNKTNVSDFKKKVKVMTYKTNFIGKRRKSLAMVLDNRLNPMFKERFHFSKEKQKFFEKRNREYAQKKKAEEERNRIVGTNFGKDKRSSSGSSGSSNLVSGNSNNDKSFNLKDVKYQLNNNSNNKLKPQLGLRNDNKRSFEFNQKKYYHTGKEQEEDIIIALKNNKDDSKNDDGDGSVDLLADKKFDISDCNTVCQPTVARLSCSSDDSTLMQNRSFGTEDELKVLDRNNEEKHDQALSANDNNVKPTVVAPNLEGMRNVVAAISARLKAESERKLKRDKRRRGNNSFYNKNKTDRF